MNLFKIAIRVATGHTADLTPLNDLKQIAENMLEDVNDPDMQDLLNEIIDSCNQKNPKAYLLMEDLQEMEDELAAEGQGVRNWDMIVEDLRAASIRL